MSSSANPVMLLVVFYEAQQRNRALETEVVA